MGRKSKYSKELKISIVKKYLNGEASTTSLAKETGIHHSIINRWIKNYQVNGEAAFDATNHNSSYTKEFKEKVVLAYLNGEGSSLELCTKYHISSNTTLNKWIKDYNSHIELKDYIPGGDVEIYMAKSRKVNQKERLEIVDYCIKHDLDYKTTAKVYEVSYANVHNWVKKYKANGEEGLSDKRGKHKTDDEVDEVELLQRQLKKAQHQLEMSQLEVRLLKKAEEIERRRSIEQVNMKSNMKQSKKSVKKKKKKG